LTIVQQHDGQIEVDSKPGQGTCFTIYLPEVESTSLDRETNDTRALRRGSGETVLLVEDDESVRTAAQAMLQQLNYRVVTAHDALCAQEILAEDHESIDLILSDLVMPGFTGLELATLVRAASYKLCIVIMTGYLTNEIETQLETDVDAWIQKPIGLETLAETVADTLSNS